MKVIALALVGLCVGGPAVAGPVESILAEAAAVCQASDNGTFDAADAVTEVDLDNDGVPDRLIDEGRFKCSSSPASLYCGSGGCGLHAVVGETSWDFQAEGWKMTDWKGWPILLIARDGGWCGGAGSQACFEAVTWSHGQMMTVMPPP